MPLGWCSLFLFRKRTKSCSASRWSLLGVLDGFWWLLVSFPWFFEGFLNSIGFLGAAGPPVRLVLTPFVLPMFCGGTQGPPPPKPPYQPLSWSYSINKWECENQRVVSLICPQSAIAAHLSFLKSKVKIARSYLERSCSRFGKHATKTCHLFGKTYHLPNICGTPSFFYCDPRNI